MLMEPEQMPGVTGRRRRKHFPDERGYPRAVVGAPGPRGAGIPSDFKQAIQTVSHRGVVRGLHFQWDPPMGKFVRCLRGAILDVVVDVRHGSPRLGDHVAVELTDRNHRIIWVPPGFAHGTFALEDDTIVLYECTARARPGREGGILWNDPALGIAWPDMPPIVSEKDQRGPDAADLARRSALAALPLRGVGERRSAGRRARGRVRAPLGHEGEIRCAAWRASRRRARRRRGSSSSTTAPAAWPRRRSSTRLPGRRAPARAGEPRLRRRPQPGHAPRTRRRRHARPAAQQRRLPSSRAAWAHSCASPAAPRVAAVGAKVLAADDPATLWLAWGRVTWRAALVERVGRGAPDGPPYDQVREVEWVPGCAMLLAREALEVVGFLDERFFAYHEDVDWCASARGGRVSRSLRARGPRDAPGGGKPGGARTREPGALPVGPQHGALRTQARAAGTVGDPRGHDRRKLTARGVAGLARGTRGGRGAALARLPRRPARTAPAAARSRTSVGVPGPETVPYVYF